MVERWREFRGIDGLQTKYLKAIGETLLRNELGGLSNGYEISHAGADSPSGYSFGGNQMDLAGNPNAKVVLKDILVKTNANGNGLGFYNSIESKLSIVSNPNALSDLQKNSINTALSSDYGKSKLNEIFVKEVTTKSNEVDNIISSLADSNVKTTLQNSVQLKVILVDYHNQFNIDKPAPNVPAQMFNYLNGNEIELKHIDDNKVVLGTTKLKLPSDMIGVENVRKFLYSTDWGIDRKNDVDRRQNEIDTVFTEQKIGKYISGTAGRESNLVGSDFDDTISGGGDGGNMIGSEKLSGKNGYDIYKLSGSFSDTMIDDSDAKGAIYINDVLLAGAAKQYTTPTNSPIWELNGYALSYNAVAGFIEVAKITSGIVGTRNLVLDQTNKFIITGTGVNTALTGDGKLLGMQLSKTVTSKSISGSSVDDKLYGTGGNDTISANSGNDTVYGELGNDTIYGAEGNDKLFGEAGNDIIIAGIGNDSISGNEGNDIYRYVKGDGVDTIFDSGSNTDNDSLEISGYTGSNAIFTRLNNTNSLIIKFAGGSDEVLIKDGLELQGNATLENIKFADSTIKTIAQLRTEVLAKQTTSGNDNIVGYNFQANTIAGGGGNDTISGYNFNDSLAGQDGNDIINGGSGDDILIGGLGKDSLTGGLGKDTFVIISVNESSKTLGTIDTIKDFKVADDTFDFSAMSFVRLDTDGGNTEAGELRLAYDAPTRTTHIISDQTGFEVILSGGDLTTAITDLDFLW
jgi:Ca2+-binding RTX toxin-like protein